MPPRKVPGVLGVAGDALEDVSTREGVWNFLADELVPSIYPEDATDPENKFRKNTQIGAMQLRQRRVTKNEGCTIPTVYKPILATCLASRELSEALLHSSIAGH